MVALPWRTREQERANRDHNCHPFKRKAWGGGGKERGRDEMLIYVQTHSGYTVTANTDSNFPMFALLKNLFEQRYCNY